MYFRFNKEGCGLKLRHLNLTGCLYITDLTLSRLSSAIGQIPCHMTDSSQTLTNQIPAQKDPDSCSTRMNGCLEVGCLNQEAANEETSGDCECVASHAACSREGPCAVRLSSAGCCVQTTTSRQRSCSGQGSAGCHGCWRARTQSSDRGRQTHNRQAGTGCCHGNPPAVDCHGNTSLYLTDGYPQALPRWTGSTEEHLEELPDKLDKVTLHPTRSEQTHQTTQPNLSNPSKSYDINEMTPSDVNPGHTGLPDIILFTSREDTRHNEKSDTALPCVAGRTRPQERGENVTERGRDGTARRLEFLSLSGCYQVTDEGLQ